MRSSFISFQQKKKNSTCRSMKTQKRRTITLKTKQRKNTTLIDRSAAGTWCQRSWSGCLKTRENPFTSFLDYAFSCLTPDTNNQMQILNLQPQPQPKNKRFSRNRKKKRVSAVIREEETQPVSSKGDIISKTHVTKLYCFLRKPTSKVIVSKCTAPSSYLLPPYHSEVLLMLTCKMSNSRKLVSIKTTNNNKQIWNERF